MDTDETFKTLNEVWDKMTDHEKGYEVETLGWNKNDEFVVKIFDKDETFYVGIEHRQGNFLSYHVKHVDNWNTMNDNEWCWQEKLKGSSLLKE